MNYRKCVEQQANRVYFAKMLTEFDETGKPVNVSCRFLQIKKVKGSSQVVSFLKTPFLVGCFTIKFHDLTFQLNFIDFILKTKRKEIFGGVFIIGMTTIILFL